MANAILAQVIVPQQTRIFEKTPHRSPLLAMAAPATPADAWTVEEVATARSFGRSMVPRDLGTPDSDGGPQRRRGGDRRRCDQGR